MGLVHCYATGFSGLPFLFRVKYLLYTATPPKQTFLYLHPNRSRKALVEFGILEGYEGFPIHDFFCIYLPYDHCGHGLCNAHLLRDLKYLEEELGQARAEKLASLMVRAKEVKEYAFPSNNKDSDYVRIQNLPGD